MPVRTTRITVETETVTLVRRAKVAVGWCPECHAEADVITLDEQSLADEETATQIQQWIATGNLHMCRAQGRVQLCVQSLLRFFEMEEGRRFGRQTKDPCATPTTKEPKD